MATKPYSGPVREIDAGGSINYAIVSPDGSTHTLANNLINPGDMMKWDASNPAATPCTTASDYDHFIGVAEGQNPVSSNIDNGNAQNNNALNLVPVKPSGVFNMISTVGDAAYVHGQAVKIGADAQHISNQTVSTSIVGYIWNPQGLTMPAADGVVRVPVVMKTTYPFGFQ